MTTYPTEVSIRYAGRADAFKGIVRSDHPPCSRGRGVTVFKERRGRDRVIGFDRSDNRGRWSVGFGLRPRGKFYAVAARKEVDDGVCARDRSRSIRP